jgi:CheY-like chemotaxis protein
MAKRPRDPGPVRILVVDDDAPLRAVLQEFLETRGYEVEVAGSGVAAIAAARRRAPHVILLDLAMPGALRGEDVLRELAEHAPVIVATANADESVARRLLQEGAFDYVMKPFDLPHIAKVVEAALVHGAG